MNKTYTMSKRWWGVTIWTNVILSLVTGGIWLLVAIPLLIALALYKSHAALSVNNNSINMKSGFFIVNETEIPFSKINSITTQKGILGNMFGYGTLIIMTGNDIRGQRFASLEDPEKVKNELMKFIHKD